LAVNARRSQMNTKGQSSFLAGRPNPSCGIGRMIALVALRLIACLLSSTNQDDDSLQDEAARLILFRTTIWPFVDRSRYCHSCFWLGGRWRQGLQDQSLALSSVPDCRSGLWYRVQKRGGIRTQGPSRLLGRKSLSLSKTCPMWLTNGQSSASRPRITCLTSNPTGLRRTPSSRR
jgi:hypothetical protein